jgi:NAD(P)-dependent dehydrogenase (short-subunit alcohol dehydrogenase family)
MLSPRAVFVTGCSSGFGFHLVRRLLADGHRVIGGDLSIDGLAPRLLADLPESFGRLLLVPLDVRDVGQVREAVAQAIAWSPPDVLVNNAGYAVFGTQEEADLDAIRDLFEVNVIGVARVTQALLPTLRERRGTIVQLSSVAGRTVFPESGYYAATKHAVEAMSEALFQEVAPFGVRIRVIEPGSFNTGFLARAIASSKARAADSPYAAAQPGWDERKFSMLEKPQDPSLVVEAIVASLSDPAPFRRIPVGPDAARLLGLRDALSPDAWSLLAAERNGFASGPHPVGEVLSPAEVLAGRTDLDATLAAWRFGHLDHWAGSDEGRAALARLGSSGRDHA